jgi:hypothetical protein
VDARLPSHFGYLLLANLFLQGLGLIDEVELFDLKRFHQL